MSRGRLLRLVIAFGFAQGAVSMARPAVSYRALSLGADERAIGVIAGVYALLPLFAAVPLGRRTDRGSSYAETRLFFGTERPAGGPDVTDKRFMAFVDREVAPRFPEGLTVQDGRGQWRDASGTIRRERSYELVLLHPASEAKARDPHIERIRSAYERAFGQESVLRLDERTRADF
ncbi:DUF3574 domain-containing protein [Streptomyces sp. NRRL S-118]|uniref:DUF3574 domain-containing protein n=1 Tax=Streptomyces sp. NRRL S-118 TaxID=1463881 RepID=UPI000A59DA86|nr:DUF3574 domain-containing protein [Streptomyces sp. NRRL S-118]